jgi:hypothetical protein
MTFVLAAFSVVMGVAIVVGLVHEEMRRYRLRER